MTNLIKIAVVLAMAAAGTGQFPYILRKVRIAQLELLRESQASKWGAPWVLNRK